MSPLPSRPEKSRRPRRGSGEERVFAATDGRLWGATHRRGAGGAAIVFTCITDSRCSVRAAAVDSAFRLPDTRDDQLRRLLDEAPKVGRLT